MNGKKVEILLYTPIVIQIGDAENPERTKEEPVFRILGQVEAFSEAGIQVMITELLGQKSQKIPSPHAKIFIPLHKIDHVFVL